MINHRYQIVNRLGEGGSGQVFLVEDMLNRRQQSAMKILHREDQSEGAVGEQFQNEVSILATLHHPNLVRVYDFGVVRRADDDSMQGRRFLTMEFIQGVTADNWCRSLPTNQDRALHLRYIVLQALEVLAYVHRQGIIHFDIKPANLMLISGGEKEHDLPLLKLTDFGLSMRKEAAGELPLRGTLEYSAPELLRRDPFDNRIDLYSLGATLYQLMEGRCPFEADDPVDLIKKVLTAEPEFRLSSRGPYAPFLPLLKRLLQKDPSGRFQSAREVMSVLLAGAGRSPTPVFDHISKPGFVGRENEKNQIGMAISSLGAEHARKLGVATLILGPEGIGKSALLAEMVRLARASDLPVLEVNTSQRDLPFGAVLSLLPLLRAEVLSRSLQGAELMDKFADVMDKLSRTDGAGSQQIQAEWLHERDKTIESLARFFHQASLLFPLVVVVDDADLMDSESRDVLRVAARDGNASRLLVLMTGRNENGLPVASTRVLLGELGLESVVAMSTSTLSPLAVGEAIGNRLYQLYGGTPSIIVEALYSTGKLLRGEGAHETTDRTGLAEKVIRQLPGGLDQLLLVRYQSLDRGHQLALDILARFHGSAQLEVIQAVLPFQRQRTAAYLSSLEAQGLIASYDNGQRFALRHGKLKNLIGSAVKDSRQDIHLFIASTLEQFSREHSFADLQELAYQYTEGGQPAASKSWLEAAADEGMRLAAYQRARELYQQAIDLDAQTERTDSGRLNVKLARSLFHCGAFREATNLANNMLGTDPLEDSQRATLHKTAGLAQSRLGEYEEGKKHIQAALDLSSDALERVELVQELVGIDIALGSFLEAERASTAQLDRAKSLGNPRVTASIYNDLGIATFFQDLFDRSAGYFQESMKIYASSRQNARVADAMMNIGNVLSAKGDISQAIEYWENSLRLSKEYGTLNQQAQILNNLGIAHYKLRRFEVARTFYDNASAIFSRLESRQGGAYVLTNLGEVAFAEGQYERALMLGRDALKSYREMDDGQGIVETLLQLAQVHMVLGDVESSAGNLEEAGALTDKKDLETFRSRLLLLRGMHMMLVHKYEAALQSLRKAEECAHEGGEITHQLLVKLRMAECDLRMGKHDSAAGLARDAMERGVRESHPSVVAEALLLLGMIAKVSPANVAEKPLPLFRRGFEAIEKEPVSEVTWKLALALGQEFTERGQRDRGKEFLLKAKVVLQFFLGQFTSSDLKNQYLAVENKDQVVETLESFLKT